MKQVAEKLRNQDMTAREKASAILKAMGNEHRLSILCLLRAGEKCVSDMERAIGLSQSALSQHLAKLRQEGLVKTRRQAQTIFLFFRRRRRHRSVGCLACGQGEPLRVT